MPPVPRPDISQTLNERLNKVVDDLAAEHGVPREEILTMTKDFLKGGFKKRPE